MRSIKTAISTTLCAVLYVIIGRNATFACIGAVFGMEAETSTTPWRTGGNRLIGTVIGGFLGMSMFYINSLLTGKMAEILLLMVGIVLLIYISQVLGCAGAIQGGAVVFYIVMLNTTSDQYIMYLLNRMLDTGVGVSMSVMINVLHLRTSRKKTQRATPEMIRVWKKIYEEKHDLLAPNRKTGVELDKYLKAHYSVISINTKEANEVVVGNIMNNEPLKEKLPQGELPDAVTYYVGDDNVFIGIDLVTGYFCVEGSEKIYDELFVYRGLDERDLENIYLVAKYIKCTNQ